MNIDWNCEKAKGKDYCLYYNESNFIFCKQKPTNDGECWLVGLEPFVRDFTLHERPKAEQMKENKNEIPYGATHIGSDNLYYKKNECKNWFYYDCDSGVFRYSKNSWQFHETLESIEQMKETIYTKEMYERGETVGSGMTATYKDKEVLIRLGCDTFRNVVFRLDGEWVTVNVDYIKPIDTRTDREKAIDDLVRLVTTNTEFSKSYASDLFDYIKLGKIHGITFTGDK